MKAALAFVVCTGCAVDPSVPTTTVAPVAEPTYVEIQFTDTSVARPDGADAQLWVTVGRVEIQRDAGTWLPITTAPMRFDLFAVEHGDASVVASAKLAAGGYPSLRLDIDSAQLVIDGTTIPVIVDQGAIELSLAAQLAGDDARALVLDFDATKSLQMPAAPNAPATTAAPPTTTTPANIVFAPAITVASFGQM